MAFAIAAIAALTACTQRDILDEAQRSTPVTFSVAEIETRAGDTYLTGIDADIPKFGVLGYVGTSCTGNPGFFNNVAVTKQDDGSYTYGNTRYWPIDGSALSFAAYYPYITNDANGANGITLNTAAPSITFTVQNDAANQVDLMYATPLEDKSKGSDLNFAFKHALVSITFSAKLRSTSTKPVTITKIELEGIANQGTLSLTNGTWSECSNTGDTYTLNINPGVEINSTTATVITRRSDIGDIFLMIPQNLPSTAKIILTYNQESETGKTQEYELLGDWKDNTPVNYIFNII